MIPPVLYSYKQEKFVRVQPTIVLNLKPISETNLIRFINGVKFNLDMVHNFGIHSFKIILRTRLREFGLPFFSKKDVIDDLNYISFYKLDLERILFDYTATTTRQDGEITIVKNKMLPYKGKKSNDDEGINNPQDLISRFKCKVCYDQVINTCLIQCKHLVACMKCLLHLKQCPYCRTEILDFIRVNIFEEEEKEEEKEETYNDDDDDDDDDDDENNSEATKYNNYRTNILILKKKQTRHSLQQKRKRKLQKQYENQSINKLIKVEKLKCRKCLRNYVNIINLPCSHMSLCLNCYSKFDEKKCPECHDNIIQIFIPLFT